MLSVNVAGLLHSTPGTVRTYPVAGVQLAVADDLRLAAPIEGRIRLTRTGRSILVQAEFETAVEERCSRCLAPMVAPIRVSVEEEALPSVDPISGQPLDLSAEPEALRLDDHHELHLEESVREAISLAEPLVPLCRVDCRGLCPICGADLNQDPAHGHDEEPLDPRLAPLATWRPPTRH
jgi:uncharacterized protein